MRAMHQLATDGAGVKRAVDEHGTSWTFQQARRFFGVDVRKTSSSRKPGKSIEGTVDHSNGQKLVDCEACGRKRQGSAGPHAPIVVSDGVVRDCVGRQWTKTPAGYVLAAARRAA